ncbi:MAG TPA: pyrroloquinoline quinone biosynthesis protein PqqE [Chthoniobacteraceae bacterium]|nr:pyrroloquinoline quinone biosynthesis protein PqqE [Chthoniobacteraceae bacterium]
MSERPFALLAELTYQCPLHCPYCSNPTAYPDGRELETGEWERVIGEAARLGVLQAGFSGGEPLARRDLATLIQAAHTAGLYTNLLTSGIGLSEERAHELKSAGLDSVQLSFQNDEPLLADAIAGTRAHVAKLQAAERVQKIGFALSINVVLHRANIARVREIVMFADALGATRLELANVQYYGWGLRNRAQLLPSPAQALAARQTAVELQQRFAGKMQIFYVLPDYFESRPKPCMQGWGRLYLTVNPQGEVLPCPTASAIPNMRFDNVRQQSLEEIWLNSESFNRFRGTEWMPEPCQSCAMREIDHGGCRCQAALLTGDAAATDPVCEWSPSHGIISEAILAAERTAAHAAESFVPAAFRANPQMPA